MITASPPALAARYRDARVPSAGAATRVLHVFGTLACAGAELRTLDVVRRLPRGEFDFHFATLSGRVGSLEDEIRALDCPIHRLAIHTPGFPLRFRRLLARENFDVVHSHIHLTSGYIFGLAAWSDVPRRVAHFRSTHDGRGGGIVRRALRGLLRRGIDQFATHVLGVSEAALTAAWGPQWRADPRLRVIYNGLDPAVFAAPAAPPDGINATGSPLVIHVGRMAPCENHARLLAIFRAIAYRRPWARLLLVGRHDAEIERALRRQLHQWQLGDRVIFAGERRDVPRLLAAADVMIFPSLWEGLPGAVLEAAAAGLPVLASRLPATAEIAVRLPLVRCLDLEADDEEWAAVALGLTERQPHARAAARAAFAASEFHIDRAAAALADIWRAAPQPAVRGFRHG